MTATYRKPCTTMVSAFYINQFDNPQRFTGSKPIYRSVYGLHFADNPHVRPYGSLKKKQRVHLLWEGPYARFPCNAEPYPHRAEAYYELTAGKQAS
jgi:hypothetical protein